MSQTTIVYTADPESLLYVAPLEVFPDESFPPLYSLTPPTPPADGHVVALVDAEWVQKPIPVAELPTELPVIPIITTSVSLEKNDGLYDGYTDQMIFIKGAIPHIPPGIMTIIVEELIGNKIVLKEHRFDALIEETEDPIMRRFTLALLFEQSGNYLITQERLNMGLEQVNKPLRIAMEKLDFNIRKAI